LKTYFLRLARVGLFLAFLVVIVGAWVRLTDAGLGCPDWPGCYGQLVVPGSASEQADAITAFPERPLDVGKAWREMIHRYLATGLGLICMVLAGLAWLNRFDPAQPKRMPAVLLGVVIFQGLLGMWTVTLLLKPVIVVAHLLGGLTTLGLLFWLGEWRREDLLGITPAPLLKLLAPIAVIVLTLQISLGGWTSANYAALACPDFPTCQTRWWPPTADFQEGFVIWRGLGVDYEGGVLDNPARVSIHFAHRLGAILTTAILGFLGWLMARRIQFRLDGVVLLVTLTLQLIIGVSIVLYSAPLVIAVAHNGGAALLLLTVLNANQRIRHNK
jgi:cytochrome c oxidase assembly protein subunit 15